jgi:cytidylate kinase
MAIITVSRGSLSLGAALAEKLAAALDHACVGREAAREAAEKSGIAPELMMAKLEERPSVWQRMTSERALYVAAMAAFLAERAAGGQLVYHGYAGHLLLRGMPGLLRVRVISPLEQRVALVMKEQAIGEQQALAHVNKMDEARASWTKFVFGVDWKDPGLYDVVVSLGPMSVETACETLVCIARRPEFVVDGPRLEALRDFALAARVRLALLASPATRGWEHALEVKEGIAFLRGAIPDDPRYVDAAKRFRRTVSDVVMAVDGVKDVSLREA